MYKYWQYVWMLIVTVMLCHQHSFAQIDSTSTPIGKTVKDTVVSDSLSSLDFIKLSQQSVDGDLTKPISRASSDAPKRSSTPAKSGGIEYGAKGKKLIHIGTELIELYDEAYIRYAGSEITADFIALDLSTNEVFAKSKLDSEMRPTFQTSGQTVTADSIRFNIDSETGIVYGARIRQDQFYVHGATTKFVKAESDSLHIDDVIYNRNALITTCDHDHPHWGIRTSKLKMIPDKLAVIGPFDLELGGVPTPLALPFAFAPFLNFEKSGSGLMPPSEPFFNSPTLGIGMRGLGYYFALSERQDLMLTTDLYTRGSFVINAASNYKKRYKYSGRMSLNYSRQLLDVSTSTMRDVNSSWRFSLSHNQDSKAHPYRTFGGNISFSLNDFNRRNYADTYSQLNSTTNSNFSYAYRFHKNVNFSVGMRHQQNTQTRSIGFTLPEIQLRVSRFQPFKSNHASAQNEKWYEKINVQYNAQILNKVNTTDSLLFTKETLDLMRNGLKQDVSIGSSYKLLQHFSFNTNISYDEDWYFQTYEVAGVDTSGSEVAQVINNFDVLRDMTVAAGLTTNLFGTIQFKKGWLRGLRHQITPTFGLSYSPSTEDKYQFFDRDPGSDEDELIRYNPFSAQNGETLVFNNSLNRGGMLITYQINNTLEGKRWSKRDSTETKFKILNSLNMRGNYNLQADSLNWSTVSVSASSRLFNGKTTMSFNSTWDPYVEDENGVRINKTTWAEQGKLFRWESMTMTLNTQFSLKEISDIFKGKRGGEGTSSNDYGFGRQAATKRGTRLDNETDFFSWFENFRFVHNYRLQYNAPTASNPDNPNTGLRTTAHTLRVTTGDIPLSTNWSMSVNNLAYDLKESQWVFPSFTLSRDLHCWRASVSWQPQLRTFSFFIGVKAPPFSDFLKYQTGRQAFDSGYIR